MSPVWPSVASTYVDGADRRDSAGDDRRAGRPGQAQNQAELAAGERTTHLVVSLWSGSCKDFFGFSKM